MRLAYDDGLVRLYHGSLVEHSEPAGLILTDPPYARDALPLWRPAGGDAVTKRAKRRFKARWWSNHWGQRVGASYTSAERRDARAREESQIADVTVWEDDERGYVKAGSMTTYTRPMP